MNFILLHGSFHAAWNWHRVLPLLAARGHRAVALDLPSHGHDTTPASAASLAANARCVVDAIDSAEGPVVLVAHSRNGIVISQVAELRPERLAGLVYLAAYLVPHGKSMMDYAVEDVDSLVFQNVHPRLSDRVLRLMIRLMRWQVLRWVLTRALPGFAQEHRLDRAVYREALYQDCGDEVTALAEALLEPEPNWAAFTPLRLTGQRAGRVPKVYVECTEDRAVTLPLQRRMQRDTPCDRVFSLQSGHSPFFSQPARLVEVLCEALTVFDRPSEAGEGTPALTHHRSCRNVELRVMEVLGF